jgi:hypothetical protein
LFAACKLELHPEKTKIGCCKDDNHGDYYLKEKFDHMGKEFRSPGAMT